MPQLAFATGFFDEYDKLEKSVRQGVRDAMAKFQKLTSAELHADKGLHLEQITRARDPRIRTIRITGYWRGVVLAPDDGSDTFLLLKVLQHDAAIKWAVKRVVTVNSATKGLEVRNAVAIEQLTPVLRRAAEGASSRLFEEFSDGDLRHLGIDDEVLAAARTITDKAQLLAFGALMPEDQFEVLQFLAEGFSPDEVWRDVVAVRRPADAEKSPGDLGTAIANTRSRIALITSANELEDILTKPFAAWRTFLHPSQRRVAYRDHAGAAQVSGGPGTGKTVVALHRVKHLLENGTGRVLLTTFTTALVDSLRESLELLVDDPELLERVDVTTVNAFARKVVHEHRPVGRLVSDNDSDARRRWQRIIKKQESSFTEQFLALEYRHVVLAQDINTREEYLTASRAGRGASLRAAQRNEVWDAISAFTDQLAAEGALTHLQLCAEAASLLADTPPVYDHIVVDEAQDLHPAQWRVLRRAVPEGLNDLFIAGDPHQRIYDCRVSLRSLGINVSGRSSRLRINYRSTQEILAWATSVLTGSEVDDLDGGVDSLAGYRSELRGGRPDTASFTTQSAEMDALAAKVETWIGSGVRPSEIVVATRFHDLGSRARERLLKAGLPAVALKNNPPSDAEGVRIATMHAMKGLEFRCVALIGVTESALPFQAAVTPAEVDRVQHEIDLLSERCLLFVAATRAREALHISWHGPRSPLLPSGA